MTGMVLRLMTLQLEERGEEEGEKGEDDRLVCEGNLLSTLWIYGGLIF